jgi:uncharacterized protein (DUF1501 family)
MEYPMPHETSRREFLRVGLSGLPLICLGSSLPAFVSQFAGAQTVTGTTVSNDNILVVIQLTGGNDGLNTIVPVRDDLYYKARPNLGLKQKLHKLSDDFALNPGLLAFKEFYDAGQLAIVNGCGYPEPNRSHFEAMAIWHTANPQNNTGAGWLGHYIDHCRRGSDSHLFAVNIGNELPQAMVNDGTPAPSLLSIDDFRLRTDPATAFDAKLEEELIKQLNTAREGSPALQYLTRQSTNAIVAAEQIRNLTAGYSPDAVYPNRLGQSLQTIAQIISGGFGTRVFYCQTGGFDTHANQQGQHENLLKNVGDSLRAFYRDLGAKGLSEKVTVMIFSEFGRRVNQNDSAGTDHGSAGPMFVLGPKVKGGLHGAYPSLSELDNGDLRFTTDFRRVYASVLQRWLNADANQVLGGAFEPVPVL